jgi:hypothetical protein
MAVGHVYHSNGRCDERSNAQDGVEMMILVYMLLTSDSMVTQEHLDWTDIPNPSTY